jgi:hypothetical protein
MLTFDHQTIEIARRGIFRFSTADGTIHRSSSHYFVTLSGYVRLPMTTMRASDNRGYGSMKTGIVSDREFGFAFGPIKVGQAIEKPIR